MFTSKTINLWRSLGTCLVLVSGVNAGPALADATTQAVEHFRQGLAYERLGRFDDSYTELQLASNLDPTSATTALALGLLASRVGRYDEAVRALENSIVLDANSIASYYQLAMLYERGHQNDRALESWHRFLSLTQDDGLKVQAQKHIQALEVQN